jgi:hypothetical protein
MGFNGGLNNRKILMRGMVIKEKKKKLWGIKRLNERYNLKQLFTYST